MPTEIVICPQCGVQSVSYPYNKLGQTMTYRRDYTPVSFVFQLKEETRTTFIVRPEIERLLNGYVFSRIRSLDAGKNKYAIDVPLPADGTLSSLFSSDERIDSWHTAFDAPICDHHRDFKGNLY